MDSRRKENGHPVALFGFGYQQDEVSLQQDDHALASQPCTPFYPSDSYGYTFYHPTSYVGGSSVSMKLNGEDNSVHVTRKASNTADDDTNFCVATSQNNLDTATPTISVSVPLRQWVLNQGQLTSGLDQQKKILMRKITVAYALGKLLQHMKDSVSSYSQDELLSLCSADNFAVHLSAAYNCNEVDVVGIDMISPLLSMQVISSVLEVTANSYAACSTHENELWGRNVETFITKHSPFCCAKATSQDKQSDDCSLCHSFGVLLHFLFSSSCSTEMQGCGNTEGSHIYPQNGVDEDRSSRPAKLNYMPSQLQHEINFSRAMSLSYHDDHTFSGQDARTTAYNFHSLQSVGISFNVYRLVKNLLDCECEVGLFRPDDTYPSLAVAIEDISLLLREPSIFLFESATLVLKSTEDKFYGRTSEATSLRDAFRRVAAGGQSEAFVIGGSSGCGKTRLVQSAFESVFLANGILVTRKFEETSNNQLSVVVGAFDDVCVLLAERSSSGSLQRIWQLLMNEFGTNIHFLVRLLPNVLRLAPPKSTIGSFASNHADVNFFSLCDNIKRFMRVVSSSSCPVFLFLDDLQWADPVSFGLVHTVLSDLKGESCVFFVGSFRDNEVKPDHIIFGFYEKLSAFDVPLNTLHLDGMPEEDVNTMISDTLGMFPRLCRSLSQLVFRKTNGNPFFVKTFLHSLVDKGSLSYSLREKAWRWDTDKIYAENVTPNVLDLITAKMADLTQNRQTALQVASCFGIGFKVSLAQDLSATSRYSSLLHDLNEAVRDGFMDLDTDKSRYCFVHDKVREAAYGMIPGEDKDRFHFDVGMALLSTYKRHVEGKNDMEGKSDGLFDIINQVNHGVPALLHDESQRISVAKLNLQATAHTMQSYNYTSAYRYAKTAISLLPVDSWATHHDLSVEAYFQLAKSAYPCSKYEEARDSLQQVLEHASSLQMQTRLDVYDLLRLIIMSAGTPKDFGPFMVAMADVLRSLGEDLPSHDDAIFGFFWKLNVANQVYAAKKSFEKTTDASLSNTDASGTEDAVVHAYTLLVRLTFMAKINLFPYYVSRAVQYCLKSKVVSKYVPGIYVMFGAILCNIMNSQDVRVGYRIGKLALNMVNQNDAFISELPFVYFVYYGQIATIFEPIQACLDQHTKAYELGMQLGKASISALHKQLLRVRELYTGGKNLLELKEEIDIDMKMAKHDLLPILGMKSQLCYQAVSNLIDGKLTTSKDIDRAGLYDPEGAYILSRVITLTFLGYFERAKHLVDDEGLKRSTGLKKSIPMFHACYIYFFYGISSIGLCRRKKLKHLPKNLKKISDVLENAGGFSEWNFRNKASLLEAEKSSFCGMNSEAKAAYDASIAEARSSKFVHEEGLACELAGNHYESLENIEKAVSLFEQAKQCYKAWGSQWKTHQMAEKIKHARRGG